MDKRESPVGVFDSGLGGTSVLREALKALPRENYLYYGDNQNAPYGDKSEAEITRLAMSVADFLVKRGAKALLVACNTATSAAIRQMREQLFLPVVSMEPAIKPACALPGEGKVLMCATAATTRLARYQALQARMPDPDRVINVPCPGIVERVEQGVLAPDAFDDLFERYFAPYEGLRVDAIVLGCTHFTFIQEALARYARQHFSGPIRFFNGNAATARQLGRVLEQRDLLNTRGSGDVRFFTSGDRERVYPIFRRLLGR